MLQKDMRGKIKITTFIFVFISFTKKRTKVHAVFKLNDFLLLGNSIDMHRSNITRSLIIGHPVCHPTDVERQVKTSRNK